MKIHVDKTNLTQVLQKIQNVTERKTGMTILSNTLIKAEDEQDVEFLVTDLELSLWTKIETQVEVPGSVTVSARKLFDVVREIPQNIIEIESLPNDKLLVQAGRSRFELSTIPASDFPSIHFYEETELVDIDAVLLWKALNKTAYAIPSDDDSFSISGVFLHPVEGGRLRFVSTDSHRLASFEMPAEVFSSIPIGGGVIIPRKGVLEMLRLLEKETMASLGIEEKCLILRTPSTFLSVQLLEGHFPEYRAIIPSSRPYAFEMDWEPLYYGLRRVAVLTSQTWRHVRLTVKKGSLELDAGNPELGKANDVLDIDYEGEDFSVSFNIRYVMETIQAMESSRVRFEWADDAHGGVFLGPDDEGYFSLIMPMIV
jgi:DNA polymerase-3 subunit beta